MDSISSNIDAITVDVISEIQNNLNVYDIRSMTFLLYDAPHTALERLVLLQSSKTNLNLLGDWAKKAQSSASWKYEFLEVLAICQLYSIIKKLGFDVDKVKLHFLPKNAHANVYINPMKKMLYKVCENMCSSNLLKLKNTLTSYNLNVVEYEDCELVLLELMCRKFIVINATKDNNSLSCRVEKLAQILDNLPGLESISADMREVEKHMNDNEDNFLDAEDIHVGRNSSTRKSFDDIAALCKKLGDKENVLPKFKTDASKKLKGAYEIINKNRLGICYIINQEKFYPSQKSIQMKCGVLDDRKGSQHDKIQLENTMTQLNFQVIADNNLRYNDIFKNLKVILRDKVHIEDSVFILCILSHGIEGCIYSADSIPVKVTELQKILDGEDADKLEGKPKVIVIQACQVKWEPTLTLVADGPSKSKSIKKTDFLIFWATVPEYEAYRNEKKGSIFIQILCYKIHELANEEHIEDIFKKVNDSVVSLCKELNHSQVCMSIATLRKNLYLKLPD